MNISLSAFVPENLVSRDGFGSPVPRQPVHLHNQAESGAYLRDSSRVPRGRLSTLLMPLHYNTHCSYDSHTHSHNTYSNQTSTTRTSDTFLTHHLFCYSHNLHHSQPDGLARAHDSSLSEHNIINTNKRVAAWSPKKNMCVR